MNTNCTYRRIQNNIYVVENTNGKTYRGRKSVDGVRRSFTSKKLKDVREWLKSF